MKKVVNTNGGAICVSKQAIEHMIHHGSCVARELLQEMESKYPVAPYSYDFYGIEADDPHLINAVEELGWIAAGLGVKLEIVEKEPDVQKESSRSTE